MLKKFDHFDCKFVSTPFDPNVRMYSNTSRVVSQLEYARVIGYLMYAMTSARPNITFVVKKMSQYMSNPSLLHSQEVYRIQKYLKGTVNYGIHYSSYPLVLEGFTDSSWITNREDHASISGWIFTLGGGVISWGSKKQTCIADSTITTKFIALASCSKKA